MFKSPLFDAAITHRFSLTKVMRQDKNNKMFLKALAYLRLGNCPELKLTIFEDVLQTYYKQDLVTAVPIVHLYQHANNVLHLISTFCISTENQRGILDM